MLKTTIYRQNIVWASKLVPQLSFFVNLIFLVFLFFLSISPPMRKISDFKNNALKVERVPKIFENLNSFDVFCYFGIFLKLYQNMGQKLGSNRCPLFTMLTKQNSSMFCIVSFVKKTCLLVFLTCSISTHLKSLLFFFFYFFSFSSFFLSFFLSLSLFFINLRSIWRSPLTKTKECV